MAGFILLASDWFEFPKGGAMSRIAVSFILFAAVTGFLACGGVPKRHAEAAVGDSPSPTVSTSSAPPACYGSVAGLRDAFIATGYDCPDWRRTDRVKLVLQSGSCSGSDVLSIYTGSEAVQQLKSISLDGVHLVVSEDWIIDTKQAEAIAAVLGGVHVTG